MKQLGMTDAFMLAVENDRQLLQMASVSILEPPVDGPLPLTLARLRELVADRIHAVPVLRRRLMHVPLGLNFPYWVDSDTLDLDHHVRALHLTHADDRALAEVVADIVSVPLDHAKPLWELHLVDGLADGRAALVLKLHHAAVDGISAMQAHSLIFDTSPTPGPTRDLVPTTTGDEHSLPSARDLLADGVASLPRQLARSVVDGARALPYLDQLMPFRVTPGAPLVAAAARKVAKVAQSEAAAMLLEGHRLKAPRTVLDVEATGRRNWAFVSVPLAEVKQVKNRYGLTVNDVVVAITAGALRRWLADHDQLPDDGLVALVPVSVRTQDAQTGGNEVQVMLVQIPTEEPVAEKRLLRTHEVLSSAKLCHRAVPAEAMRAADSLLMPALFAAASRAAMLLTALKGPTANVVVSNVPGPQEPVYVDGHRVEAFFPVGGVVAGFGLGTIVFSYSDQLHVGFVVDAGCPLDPWRMADAFAAEHQTVVALAER